MPDTNQPEYSAQTLEAMFPLTKNEVSSASSSYWPSVYVNGMKVTYA